MYQHGNFQLCMENVFQINKHEIHDLDILSECSYKSSEYTHRTSCSYRVNSSKSSDATSNDDTS